MLIRWMIFTALVAGIRSAGNQHDPTSAKEHSPATLAALLHAATATALHLKPFGHPFFGGSGFFGPLGCPFWLTGCTEAP
jgi:hypothetical protein